MQVGPTFQRGGRLQLQLLGRRALRGGCSAEAGACLLLLLHTAARAVERDCRAGRRRQRALRTCIHARRRACTRPSTMAFKIGCDCFS
jgi:hypothetical protein